MAEVLIVDDERSIVLVAKRLLMRHGHIARTATSIQSAKRCIPRYPFDAVFLDVWIGSESGLDLYDWILAEHPRLGARVAFMTGDLQLNRPTNARLLSFRRPMIAKPFGGTDLLAALDMAMSRSQGATLSHQPTDQAH